MREIKFRGIRKDNGKWVYGDLIHEPWGTMIQSIETKMPTGVGAPEAEPTKLRHKYTVDPDTVGEWTGLTDTAGKDLYEGDIVCIDDETFVVEFASGAFGLYRDGQPKGRLYHYYKFCRVDNTPYVPEIIGNIHTTPRLLEADNA